MRLAPSQVLVFVTMLMRLARSQFVFEGRNTTCTVHQSARVPERQAQLHTCAHLPASPTTHSKDIPKSISQVAQKKSQEIVYGNSDVYDADDVDHEPDDADLKMV